mmetsp:Transcript_16158/g.56388  ORF Transcript_16158/g.56388 Transcript_16158/m.56388 type:complete len:287 (-) Transcript_16158:1947-2807(-)
MRMSLPRGKKASIQLCDRRICRYRREIMACTSVLSSSASSSSSASTLRRTSCSLAWMLSSASSYSARKSSASAIDPVSRNCARRLSCMATSLRRSTHAKTTQPAVHMTTSAITMARMMKFSASRMRPNCSSSVSAPAGSSLAVSMDASAANSLKCVVAQIRCARTPPSQALPPASSSPTAIPSGNTPSSRQLALSASNTAHRGSSGDASSVRSDSNVARSGMRKMTGLLRPDSAISAPSCARVNVRSSTDDTTVAVAVAPPSPSPSPPSPPPPLPPSPSSPAGSPS